MNFLTNRNRLTDTEETCSTKGEREGLKGKDWEFGISKGKLLYIGWTKNKVLLLFIYIYTGELYLKSCDTDEHRCKNPQQNSSNQNPTTH